MKKKRGKVPSLISGSSGKPKKAVAKRSRKCSRCEVDIVPNETCFEVPKVGGGFSSKKTFCLVCFKELLKQTKIDIAKLEEEVPVS